MNHTPDTTELQNWLDRWAARRALARRMIGSASLVAAALAVALVVFALDWSLRSGLTTRALMLVVWLALLIYLGRRVLRTRRRSRECPLDLALIVERRRRLEGDLVAALQFGEQMRREPPETAAPMARGASRQLRRAVIGYVSEYAKSLPPEPVPWPGRATGAMAALIALAAIWAGLFVRAPEAVAAFGRRLLLVDARYPTRTRIESIRINGRAFAPSRAMKAAAGESLTIAVRGSDDLPHEGRIVARGDAGQSITLVLKRTADGPHAEYIATLPALTDPLRGAIYLGDAWVEEFHVQPAERPRAALSISVEPPEYGAGEAPPAGKSGTLLAASATSEIAALAGSRIGVEVICDNKPLASAVLVHNGREFDLTQAGGRRRWKLASAPQALQAVAHDTAFSVRVVDADGLSTPDSFSCVVRALADQPPTARAEALTTLIVPGARPTIAYHVADDVGLAKVLIERQVVRAGEIRPLEPIEIAVNDRSKTVDGRMPVETSELSLRPGDELRATVAAVDFRGAEAGRRAVSEMLRFRVAKEAEVLAALAGDDEQPISRDTADRIPAEELP